MNSKYHYKYLKYKEKYLNLHKNILTYKKEGNYKKGGGDNDILYDNIKGKIDPDENLITLTKFGSIPLSDHYLLYKSIELSNANFINLFNINISQQFQFKTKIKNGLFFNTMRSKENLEFMFANKKNIIGIIIQISKNYLNLLKEKNIEQIKLLFVNQLEQLDIIDPSKLTDLEIKIIKVSNTEASTLISDNLNLDPETNFYYTFDVEFNNESLDSYEIRVKNILEIINNNIGLINLSDGNQFIVINIQELSPLDKILYLFDEFVYEIKEQFGIELKIIYNNTDTIDSGSSYSLSIVSTNTNYSLDMDTSSDDIMEFIINQKKNQLNKNFKITSTNEELPNIYNFHTGMFYYKDFVNFIDFINEPNKYIMFGDFNLKLPDTEYDKNSIKCIKKIADNKNIHIEYCATPESHYPNNNYTYDILMYKI